MLKFVRTDPPEFWKNSSDEFSTNSPSVCAEHLGFLDEMAQESEVKAKVVQIFKDYNETLVKAGRPYRYG